MDTLASYLNWNVVTAALAVIGLLIVVLLVFRAFSGRVRGRRGARLGISEYHEIDKTRRLVLVRRDGIEHLVMIGGAQDLVIETGISFNEADARDDSYMHRPPASERVPAASPPRRTEEPALRSDEEAGSHGPIPLRAAPRPPVFGDRAPKLKPVGRDEPRLAPPSDHRSDET